MRRIWIAGLISVLATIWMPITGYSQNTDNGKNEYSNHCASCHGQTGKGDGPVAKSLSKAPADLTKLSAANGGVFPAARIYEVIDGRREVGAHGTREMPVWGRAARYAPAIVRDRIRAVVNYIATLQGK
jgi:mono/diheme cytochrome c family protein